MRARRRISSGGVISALELSNIATLVLLDVTHLVVYIPCDIVYLLLSIANLTASDSGLIFVFYQLADICNLITMVSHSLTFFYPFLSQWCLSQSAFWGVLFVLKWKVFTELLQTLQLRV